VPQLGPLSPALRNAFDHEVNEATFPAVVKQMQTIRSSMPAPAAGSVPATGQQMPGQETPAPAPAQPQPQQQPGAPQ
jgi:hypothetical protein